MGPLGWQETVVIFVVALLIFGPKKLPELGRNLAKAVQEFRRASSELRETFQREMSAIEQEGREIQQAAAQIGNEVNSSLTAATDSGSGDYNYDDYGYRYDQDLGYSPDDSLARGASATQGAELVTGEELPKVSEEVAAVERPAPGLNAPEGAVEHEAKPAGVSTSVQG